MSSFQNNFSQKIDYEFNLVLIEDSAVGKSQLLARFSRNKFCIKPKATIGVKIQSRILTVDTKTIRAQLWDTAGQERYRAVTHAYYRGTVRVMLVYDITKRQSFDNVTKLLDELRRHAKKNIVIMLIGNKTDLGAFRVVPNEDAKEFSQRENLFFMETSSLDGNNVEPSFLTVIAKMVSRKMLLMNEEEDSKGTNIVVRGQDIESKGKGCCRTS